MNPSVVVEARSRVSLAEPGPSRPTISLEPNRPRTADIVWSAYVALLHPPETEGVCVMTYRHEVGRGDYRTRHAGAKGSEVVQMVKDLRPKFATMQTFAERATRQGRTYHDAPCKAEWALASLGSVWIELDFYKKRHFAHRSAEDMAALVIDRLQEQNLPLPSFIVSSGRGLYGVWQHERLAPYGKTGALAIWKAVQKHLNDRFVDYGRDIAAMSPTTNLRVAGSRNGERFVRIIWPTFADEIRTHSFADLKAKFLPYTAEQVRAYREEKAAKRTERKAAREAKRAAAAVAQEGTVDAPQPAKRRVFKLTRQTFQRAVIRDLDALFEARFQGHPVPQGERDLWLYALTTAAAWVLDPVALREEVRRLAPLCGLQPRRAMSLMGAVLRNADRAANGQTRRYKGRPGCDYRYRTNPRRIVAEFGVTVEEAEALDLRVLVPRALKATRTAQRAEAYRRSRGATSRTALQAERLAYGQHALERRAAGTSVDELAFEARARFGEGKGSKSWVEKAMREARAVAIGKPEAKAVVGRPRKRQGQEEKNPCGSSRSITGLDKPVDAVVDSGQQAYVGAVHSVHLTKSDTRAAVVSDPAALDVPEGEERDLLDRFRQGYDGRWYEWDERLRRYNTVHAGYVNRELHRFAGVPLDLELQAQWDAEREEMMRLIFAELGVDLGAVA